mgnify:FL=1
MVKNTQEKRSEKLKQQILDTALEIGLQEGFEALSIRKITKKMQYSTGIIYHHFKNKQEIIDAIVAVESQSFSNQILKLLDDKKDVITNMETIFHYISILAFKEPEKYNLVVTRKYSSPKAERPIWIHQLSEFLKKGIQDGLIREIDPDKAAFSIWSSFLGFNLMISRTSDLTLTEVEAMFRVQFDLITKGILYNR